MNSMSDRLKGTLEQIDGPKAALNEIVADFADEDIIGKRGGEVVPFEMKQVATSVPVVDENNDIRDDYVTSRNLTHTLIEMAGEAIQGALTVAIETQHPKAYTVFNELATTMRGLSKDLLDMQKIYKEISAEKEAKAAAAKAASGGGNTTTINNNFSNLSLSDVLKMAAAEEEKKVIDIDVTDVEVNNG